MRGGGEGVTNGTGLLLCQTADSRTEESLDGPVRGGGGGFASLHSLDILRPLFGLFRPYSESLGSAGFLSTQYHTCMCMHVHANQLQVHVGISVVVTGQRALGIGQRAAHNCASPHYNAAFFGA